MGTMRNAVQVAQPLILAWLLTACGGSDGSVPSTISGVTNGSQSTGGNSSTTSYIGTTGNNDDWNIDITPSTDVSGDGSFTASNDPSTTPLTGTYTIAPSGFTKFTCSDGPGCTGYGFMIAENVVALWFTNPATLPIIAVMQGSCPTTETPAVHNFVRLPTLQDQQNGWYTTSEGSGLSSMYNLSTFMNFDITNVTFEPVVKAPVMESGYTCNQGTISKGSGVNAVNIYMTDSGVMARTDGAVGGGFIGLARPESSLANLSAILGQSSSQSTKEFLGIQWNSKQNTVLGLKGRYVTPGSEASYDDGKKSLPCVGSALGCIFSRSVDLDSGAPFGQPYVKTFLGETTDNRTTPATVYYGLFTTNDTQGDGAIAMKNIAGKYLLFEAAKLTSTGGNPGDPYNAIMVEK